VTDQAAFWRLEVYESVGSTSDICRERAVMGEPDGLAVRAGWQTAGRGSRGRKWLSKQGNLFLSVLLRPSDPAGEAGLWALLAGVAVAEALDRPDIALKWPNDILRNGKKLGGILIETQVGAEGRLDWLVIGIGLNLRAAPLIEGRDIAAITEYTDADLLGQAVLARIAALRELRQKDGWAPIRAAWLAHALEPGCAMTLRVQDRLIDGLFAGLGEDGSLLLEIDGRVQAFSTGEIWRSPVGLEHNAC
jgi:BirA family biotin operon repressor/biotin-[acetyl-CoA-carboxylase] ligase